MDHARIGGGCPISVNSIDDDPDRIAGPRGGAPQATPRIATAIDGTSADREKLAFGAGVVKACGSRVPAFRAVLTGNSVAR